ncbi:substrate-binding domain-containing protein [Pseudonocardia humida]|uniref:Substrate-binding domain-containing protein n=1 Tax=Pseudonocardia humida TaxID=2800819 RepID=A0ABT0ZS49_9PSEU|nr:substrate-binding domain-containing protein [Pseudonocardia humida]MCO1653539.1 substrate-binding domain-containing protein [Pseudonocardia humida]
MGQHRKLSRRRRWPLVVLGVVVAVAAAAGVVVYRTMSAPTCEPVPVVVAADPSILEPVSRLLAADPDAVDTCARYDIVAADPGLASEIRSGSPGLPDVWIPESSLTLDPLDESGESLVERGAPLAYSPVVLALPAADAARYGDPSQPIAWNTLLTSEKPPTLPDPVQEPGGLAALTALRTAIGDDDGRPKAAFVAAVLVLAEGSPASAEEAFQAIATEGAAARAFLASEQAVVRHNAASEGSTTTPAGAAPAPAAAVALADGTAVLDYPLVRIRPQDVGPDSEARAARVREAVDRLDERLRSPAAHQAFADSGLRAPDGSRATRAAAGMLPVEVTTGAVPDTAAAVETLRLWSALTLQSRVLAVIDTSGSMAAQEGPTDRIGLASSAAQGGLSLFPDSSSIGLWAFSSGPDGERPWEELVPLGRLTEPVGSAPSRRAALATQAATLRDRLGGKTALYDTAIAAVREVRSGYEPGRSNAVVLITDGRNEIEGGIDLPLAVQTLRAEADPTRPVALIAIGIGPDSDQDALRQLAEATGGRAYAAENPQDIRTVFLDALSQRVCRPGC